jgi:DNA replication protein DnaC
MNLSDIIQYKNGTPHYDLPNTIQYLQYKGKKQFGDHFHISTHDFEVIYQIISWIVNDQKACDKYNISYPKGILLSGPVGCGKTSIMKLISTLVPRHRAYSIRTARGITMEFSKQGYDTINKYSRSLRSPKAICFDDIGVEPPMRYFGDSINVMAEILLSRYDLFISKGILTHATTNLNALELENRYGNRVRSRLREMFNLISYPPNAEDKRQ